MRIYTGEEMTRDPAPRTPPLPSAQILSFPGALTIARSWPKSLTACDTSWDTTELESVHLQIS